MFEKEEYRYSQPDEFEDKIHNCSKKVWNKMKNCKHDCEDMILHEYILDDKVVYKLKCIDCGLIYLEEYLKKDMMTVEEFFRSI